MHLSLGKSECSEIEAPQVVTYIKYGRPVVSNCGNVQIIGNSAVWKAIEVESYIEFFYANSLLHNVTESDVLFFLQF